MNWSEVEWVSQRVIDTIGGRTTLQPQHSGPLVGGLGSNKDDNVPYITSPPLTRVEFQILRKGKMPTLRLSGSGLRPLRRRTDPDSALDTVLEEVTCKPQTFSLLEGDQEVKIVSFERSRTKSTDPHRPLVIDHGLELTARLTVTKDEVRMEIRNTSAPDRQSTFYDFRFRVELDECEVHVPKNARDRKDVPMYIETVNAAAELSNPPNTIELLPFGIWDQRRSRTIEGPTFDEAMETPFAANAIDLGDSANDFLEAARISTKAMAQIISPYNDRYHKFQYDLRPIIYQAMTKSWKDGIPRAVIDNAPTAAGKSEVNFDAAAVATLVLKRKTTDNDCGTVAVICEPIRTLASEQLDRLFRYLAAMNDKLPDQSKVTMGFYMGTQEGRGIPYDASADVTLQQVPISDCPFCATPLRLDFDIRKKRLTPACNNCKRRFSWIYLTVRETEQFVPNIVVATLDKLCYEMGRNLGVHIFFGREYARCGSCGRAWPVTSRVIRGEGKCWACGSTLNQNDFRRSHFSALILDEAHSFRGSMGSSAGLYITSELTLAESVIKKAPVIIASTATVKKANELLKHLSGSREWIIVPKGEVESEYFRESQDHHRRFVFTCSNASNRIAIPWAVSAVKEAWDECRKQKPEAKLPERIPQIVFTKKRSSADNLHNAIYGLPGLQSLGIISHVIHGESTKQEIRQRLVEVEGNKIDVLFVTLDLIALGLDIPSISILHFDGMPEDYAKFLQAVGRSARPINSAGLVFIWLRMNMPGESYYLEHFRDLFLYREQLMPVIPINRWFSQSIRNYVPAGAIQYSFFMDRNASIFSPAVAIRRFTDQVFQSELYKFLVGTLSDIEEDRPEDLGIAQKSVASGIQFLSSTLSNTPTSGLNSTRAMMEPIVPRGIRGQSGDAQIMPIHFTRELMSVHLENSLRSAGFTDQELEVEEGES